MGNREVSASLLPQAEDSSSSYRVKSFFGVVPKMNGHPSPSWAFSIRQAMREGAGAWGTCTLCVCMRERGRQRESKRQREIRWIQTLKTAPGDKWGQELPSPKCG